MTDFIKDEQCVTHHCCDCIAKRLDKLQAENEQLRKILDALQQDVTWCYETAWNDKEGMFVENVAERLRLMKMNLEQKGE